MNECWRQDSDESHRRVKEITVLRMRSLTVNSCRLCRGGLIRGAMPGSKHKGRELAENRSRQLP
jgi:hypothetical protein